MNQELTEVRPGPRWQRRKGARPTEILDAAMREFVVTGYAATRLEDIARRAGVTKGTMYLYFANKEELFKVSSRARSAVNVRRWNERSPCTAATSDRGSSACCGRAGRVSWTPTQAGW